MVFQQFNLVGRLDVLTNVLIGRLANVPPTRSLLRLWPDRDKAVALAALEQFGMAQLAAQRADQLSGGQQQRVAIARALVQEPEIVLADEPIASLDPHNTRLVMDALQRINKHFGITVMCNLHSLEIARGYCDRLIGMAAGAVVFDDVAGGADRERPHAASTAPPPTSCRRTPDAAIAGSGLCRKARRRSRSPETRRPERRLPSRSAELASERHWRDSRCSIVVSSVQRGRAHLPAPRAASAADWKKPISGTDFAVVPAENASGVSDRYAPFVDYLTKSSACRSSCASPTTMLR